MITFLAFILTLGVLITIHEYGHYRVAVACGVKVLRFSIGFGRVLWRRQATPDSTEFVVCLLPLGGYVKMLDEREGPVPTNQLEHSFNRQPLWQRAAIVAAGPAANLLLAVVLYACAHWIGIDEAKAVIGPPSAGSLAERAGLRAGDWVREASSDGSDWHELRAMSDLRWELTQAMVRGEALHVAVTDRDGRGRRDVLLHLESLGNAELDAKTLQRIGIVQPFSEPVLGDVVAGGAAARAGLMKGDRVLRIDDQQISDGSVIRDLIRASARSGTAQAMHWRVERAGQAIDIDVTPVIEKEGTQRIGRIGVKPGQPWEMVNVRYGPVEGLTQAVTQTWQMSVLTVKMLGKMLIGQASLKNLSGPLTIADVH